MSVIIDYLTHLASLVRSGSIVAKTGEHAVIIGIVTAEHGAISSSSLGCNKVCASARFQRKCKERRNG